MSVNVQELVAVNLRYDSGAVALRTRAVAQLVAKVLFAAGKLTSKLPRDIGAEAGHVLGINALREDVLSEALNHLVAIGLAKESHGRWLLTPSGYSGIEQDLARSEARSKSILARHFPARIDAKRLRNWFEETCVAFFELFGGQWAAALSRRTSHRSITRQALAGILRRTAEKHSLAADAEALADGFLAFINSPEPEDVEHAWSLGQAMLAAQLVAANVGMDPITANEFRDCLLLLDTNALIVTSLEAHSLGRHVEELGRTLARINARVGVIPETIEEYERVIPHRREQTLTALARYPRSVLRDAGDEFIDTAMQRQCSTLADFDQFFDELQKIPDALSAELPIEQLNDLNIAELSEQGRRDERLRQAIQEHWSARRGNRTKTLSAATHDAVLTTVVEGLRARGKRCAVVTLDRTMYDHAVGRVGQTELPTWLTLDGLIQVLAVDNAAVGADSTEFAPLMASIIRHQVEPALNTYTIEDLAILADIEERAAGLKPDQVKALASQLARARYAGKDPRDPEIQLAVRRAFQAGRFNIADELARATTAKRAADTQLIDERDRRESAEHSYVEVRARELRRKSVEVAIAKGILAFALAVGLVIGGWRTAVHYDPNRQSNFIQILLTFVVAALSPLVWFARKVIPAALHENRLAHETAERELQQTHTGAAA